jgi:hypothetical protein
MVQVVGYSLKTPKEGKPYVALELEGAIEMVQSQNTGRHYATVRRCVVSSTFDEHTAARMVGKEMAGSIERVSCEPYEFTIRETGEVTLLSYRWDYQPEGARRFTPPRQKSTDYSKPSEILTEETITEAVITQ